MTTAKIDAKFSAQVGDVLAPHVDPLMSKLRAGKVDTLHVIGTLVPSERVEPTPGEDKEASVKLRLVTAEIPTGDQAKVLQEVQRALWLVRTATGTITEEGDIALAKHTLKDAGFDVAHLAAARLRAGVDQWAKQARAATTARLSGQEMWHEMERIADGLQTLLGGPDEDEDVEPLGINE